MSGDRGIRSLPPVALSTRCQLQPRESENPRRCQRCDRELPEQTTGRPRKYCTRCSPSRKASAVPEGWYEEQAARLRAAHEAAIRLAQARRGDTPSNLSDPGRRPPAASESYTLGKHRRAGR